ncbi:MAG: helix-turn-helix transcriptional regulator, partial [Planctomycetota bacterium]
EWPAPLLRALAALEAAPERTWPVGELAARAGIGRSRLHLLFERHLGQSPAACALRLRLRAAQAALRDTAEPVTALALRLGFSSSQHFATAFRTQFGLTPTAYRRGMF